MYEKFLCFYPNSSFLYSIHYVNIIYLNINAVLSLLFSCYIFFHNIESEYHTSQNLTQWKWEQVRKIFATYFKSLDGPFHMQFCFWFLQYYAFWTLKKYVKLTSITKLHSLHQGSQLNLLSCQQSSSVPRNLTMTPRKSCSHWEILNKTLWIQDLSSKTSDPFHLRQAQIWMTMR